MALEKWRILVVEDQPLVAETLVAALGDEHTVRCATSAVEALDLLRASASDLVLLDCVLPGGHAGDVMARADTLDVPVVLMSGDVDRINALSDGPRLFLAKPFSIDALLSATRSALPEKRCGAGS